MFFTEILLCFFVKNMYIDQSRINKCNINELNLQSIDILSLYEIAHKQKSHCHIYFKLQVT